MFQTLDATWDRSARRGWSTLASFTMQALALSLLLAIPLVLVQGPPRLHWIDASIFSPPPALAPAPPPRQQVAHHALEGSEVRGTQIIMPTTIPTTITPIVDAVPPAPRIGDTGFQNGIGNARQGVWQSVGETVAAIPPPRPAAPTKPPRVSEFGEGNLVYRVQPQYPQIARMAGIQGPVHLRAIVSKTGVIENLTVIDGHAMLIQSAVEAVKHWRYRPYMLNGEPIAVETDITVNFILGR
ncbi:MAG TPA: energy transducer TonB [Terriglobales bacterium]|nr:energy transducer TonB [Terriglobales bacterium]